MHLPLVSSRAKELKRWLNMESLDVSSTRKIETTSDRVRKEVERISPWNWTYCLHGLSDKLMEYPLLNPQGVKRQAMGKL